METTDKSIDKSIEIFDNYINYLLDLRSEVQVQLERLAKIRAEAEAHLKKLQEREAGRK